MIRMNGLIVLLKYAKTDVFLDNRKHQLCEGIKTVVYLCPGRDKNTGNAVIPQTKLTEKSVFNVNL